MKPLSVKIELDDNLMREELRMALFTIADGRKKSVEMVGDSWRLIDKLRLDGDKTDG